MSCVLWCAEPKRRSRRLAQGGRRDRTLKKSTWYSAARSMWCATLAWASSFTDKNVRIIRPGCGLAPRELPKVLGRKARRALSRGTALTWDAVE